MPNPNLPQGMQTNSNCLAELILSLLSTCNVDLFADFSTAEVVFSSIGGLRGAISLILAQMVVTEHRPGESGSNGRVLAQVSGLRLASDLQQLSKHSQHPQRLAFLCQAASVRVMGFMHARGMLIALQRWVGHAGIPLPF